MSNWKEQLVNQEAVEEEQELPADEEALDVRALVDQLTAMVRARVGVLVRLHVDALEPDDRDLATLEQRDPGEHDDEQHDLEGRVRVLVLPRRVVPLLPDPVDHDDQPEDEQQRGPPVRELAPRDGEGSAGQILLCSEAAGRRKEGWRRRARMSFKKYNGDRVIVPIVSFFKDRLNGAAMQGGCSPMGGAGSSRRRPRDRPGGPGIWVASRARWTS